MHCTHCGSTSNYNEYSIEFARHNRVVTLSLCESCLDDILAEDGTYLL